MVPICSVFWLTFDLIVKGVSFPGESFDWLSNPRETFFVPKYFVGTNLAIPLWITVLKGIPQFFYCLRCVVFHESFAFFLSISLKTYSVSLTIERHDTRYLLLDYWLKIDHG